MKEVTEGKRGPGRKRLTMSGKKLYRYLKERAKDRMNEGFGCQRPIVWQNTDEKEWSTYNHDVAWLTETIR